MKVKELIYKLNKLNQEKEIIISVDISTCDEDFDRRVYVDEFLEIQGDDTILFIGYSNEGLKQ